MYDAETKNNSLIRAKTLSTSVKSINPFYVGLLLPGISVATVFLLQFFVFLQCNICSSGMSE